MRKLKTKFMGVLMISLTLLVSMISSVLCVKAITNNSTPIVTYYVKDVNSDYNTEIYELNSGGTVYPLKSDNGGEFRLHVDNIDVYYTKNKKTYACGMSVQVFKDKACKKAVSSKQNIEACGSLHMDSLFLDKGTYYLKVWNKSHTNASGMFNACLLVGIKDSGESVEKSSWDYPNKLVANKKALGVVKKGESDYYKFELKSTKYVTLYTRFSGKGTVTVYDSKKNKIVSKEMYKTSKLVLDKFMEKGEYYIKLSTTDKYCESTLSLRADSYSVRVSQVKTPKSNTCTVSAWGVKKELSYGKGKLSSKSKKFKVIDKQTSKVKITKKGWYTFRYIDTHDRVKTKQVYVKFSSVKKPSSLVYKKNTKKITGVCSNASKVYAKINNKTYKASVKKGKFNIKTCKLKSGMKIKLWAKNKNGDTGKTVTVRVKAR